MLKALVIVCTRCDSVLDVLIDKEEPLYVDKKCDCGCAGFYVHKIDIKLSVITEKPIGKEPFFERDGESFYIGDEKWD